jgi:O-antigen chain-terminating methyltransferase
MNFYRAFEDKHRGSRELIKGRLGFYEPFVSPLLGGQKEARAIDLGCGRGEWLEVVQALGFEVIGVELDRGMLEGLEGLGFHVELIDAVEFLEQQPDASADLVTGFHIAEHMPFAKLQALVEHVYRVLRPGGLLILETPNPENITVGTNGFYMDPTHKSPLPTGLLSFLPEYCGFARTQVVRLQEPERLRDEGSRVSLLDVLESVSPDYAVIAQKAGDDSRLQLLDALFHQDYGLGLPTLAMRYEQQAHDFHRELTASVGELAGSVDRSAAAARESHQRANEAYALAEQVQARAIEAEARAELWHERADQLQTELVAVIASRSWRITAPLRWILFQLRLLRTLGPRARARSLMTKMASPVLRRSVIAVRSRPRLHRLCVRILHRVGLYGRIRSAYHDGRFFREVGSLRGSAPGQGLEGSSVGDLTPEAQAVYSSLDSAIKRKREKR